MKAVRIVVWLAVLVVFVSFAVTNPSETVHVNLWRAEYNGVPLVIALAVAFVVGILLALVYGSSLLIESALEVRKLRGQMRTLERELHALRNLSIEDGTGGEELVSVATPPGEREERREDVP